MVKEFLTVAGKGNKTTFFLILVFFSGLFAFYFNHKIDTFQSKEYKYDNKYISSLHLNKILLLNIKNNKLEDFKYILSSNKYKPDIEEIAGLTPFNSSILYNNFEAAEKLFSSGNIDINFINKNNLAPIHFAINNPNLNFLKLLINNKDFNYKIKFETSNLLHIAAYNKKYKALKILSSKFPSLKKERNNQNLIAKDIVKFHLSNEKN
ncbi:ankyrin repeat domain-containing protein [bacterium]|nr:ankyrin repeat domain-containing protein [bacterium]